MTFNQGHVLTLNAKSKTFTLNAVHLMYENAVLLPRSISASKYFRNTTKAAYTQTQETHTHTSLKYC